MNLREPVKPVLVLEWNVLKNMPCAGSLKTEEAGMDFGNHQHEPPVLVCPSAGHSQEI